MNIIMLAEVSCDRVLGGAERVLRAQALGLRRLRHRVGVVARAPAGDPRPHVVIREDESGQIVEHRYAVSRDNALAFAFDSIRGSVRAFDLTRAGAPLDAVMSHQSLGGLGPIMTRRAQARAWVYVCHSLAHEEYRSRTVAHGSPLARGRLAANAALRLWIERTVLRRSARIIVLSEFMKQRVRGVHGIPEQRIRIIPGAADPTRFHPPEKPEDVRRRVQLPLSRVVLLTVRNLVPRMGLETLLHAIARLGDERHNLLLVIGGEGPLRPALEQLIGALGLADHVRMVGFIGETELPLFYQAADLVLMPTHELEGFGLVTVESWACGTPVLGTPVGALPEVLARVDPGLVAEGSDAVALAQAIRRILGRFRDDPGERARLSARGRALVEKEYNWERHTTELEAVIQEAIEEGQG